LLRNLSNDPIPKFQVQRKLKLIELLPSKATDPTLTASWESQLDEIAQGNTDLQVLVDEQVTLLSEMLGVIGQSKHRMSTTSEGGHKCTKCEGLLIRRKGKYGYFWGCGNYPDCKENYKDINKKPFLEKEKYPCTQCEKGHLQLRSGKKGKFWGCSNFPGCKVTKQDVRGRTRLAV
jgi:DNA topoisomerase-3